MPFAIRQLISRGYWAPAGDDGAAGGGDSVDRGDDVQVASGHRREGRQARRRGRQV